MTWYHLGAATWTFNATDRHCHQTHRSCISSKCASVPMQRMMPSQWEGIMLWYTGPVLGAKAPVCHWKSLAPSMWVMVWYIGPVLRVKDAVCQWQHMAWYIFCLGQGCSMQLLCNVLLSASVCCSMCNFYILRKWQTWKTNLSAFNFALNWGEGKELQYHCKCWDIWLNDGLCQWKQKNCLSMAYQQKSCFALCIMPLSLGFYQRLEMPLHYWWHAQQKWASCNYCGVQWWCMGK